MRSSGAPRELIFRYTLNHTIKLWLARAAGMNVTMISRFVKWTLGSDDPEHKRPMGEKVARKIEKGLGKPDLWMDVDRSSGVVIDPPADLAIVDGQAPAGSKDQRTVTLSPMQRVTHDAMVNLMANGKLPDSECIKLLQSWQRAVAQLEAGLA